MRHLLLIIVCVFIAFSCVKQNTKNPKPVIEFIEVNTLGKSQYTNSDTAVMVIGYEDGDGDLFVDSNTDEPNFVFTPYAYNETTKKFAAMLLPPPMNDTFRISATIKQPDNGYYKGKSIKGQIRMPMNAYRTTDKKIIMFTGFMIDMKKNKSNLVSSPAYTLTF